MDMLGAMQAMHRRFKTETNSASKTGEIRISSADGDKNPYASEAGSSSGDVIMASGRASGEAGASGQISIETGKAAYGDAGNITMSPGTSHHLEKSGSVAIQVLAAASPGTLSLTIGGSKPLSKTCNLNFFFHIFHTSRALERKFRTN